MPNSSRRVVPVVWLIAAHDQFENALSQAGEFVGKTEPEQRSLLKERMDQVDRLLRRTFQERKPEAIVVLERLGGYSGRSDRHVLRVEIQLPEHPSADRETNVANMVKVGPCHELCREVAGRRTCERSANARGRTLLHVKMGVCPRRLDAPQQLCDTHPEKLLGTIIYQDAYHTLRATRVAILEKAFLNCVRWGTPSPLSVLGVLDQVYQELQNHCYERAPAIRPVGPHRSILEQLEHRLKKGLDRWKDGTSIPRERRIVGRELLPKDLFPFVDLLDFCSRAFRQLHYQSELRFGRAHGDLHSRNVAVGLINGEANWPAVYDFEDMGANNFMAWDFVKMEMELKIRAMRFAFPCPPDEFVRRVWDFETRLNEATEEKNQQSFEAWQDDVAKGWNDPASCLHALLLGRAYEASEDYYPGISLATLEFLIAVLQSPPAIKSVRSKDAEFRKLAEKIKESLLDDDAAEENRRQKMQKNDRASAAQNCMPAEPDDRHWRLASLGEACLLLGEPAAYGWYRQAWTHEKVAKVPHAQDAIRRQAYRIMTHQEMLGASKTLRELHGQLRGLFESGEAKAMVSGSARVPAVPVRTSTAPRKEAIRASKL